MLVSTSLAEVMESRATGRAQHSAPGNPLLEGVLKRSPRLELRSRVMRDVGLSVYARMVYMLLDDEYARDHGRAWPKQTTLAAVTGLSRRQVQRELVALCARGYIVLETRASVGCCYILGWHQSAQQAHHEAPSRRITSAQQAHHGAVSLYMNQGIETGAACAFCGDTGRTQDAGWCACDRGSWMRARNLKWA